MNHPILFRGAILSFAALQLAAAAAFAKDAAPALAIKKTEAGMTLLQLIRAGGGTMILLGLISVAALAFVIYFFLTYRPEKIAPEEFSRNVTGKLAAGRVADARQVCLGQENILARITIAALDREDRGAVAMREAAELTAKTEVSKLWEGLSYLSDIAVIAPLVGLLGTVLGMIDSFNVIAFATGSAKPVLLAGGIAKAMVATAGGLVIAIPASIFYSFFRAKVFKITAKVESFTSEAVDILTAETAKGFARK